ncbi:MAG: NgoFVII family restriction endonuclease [Brevinema sp.]
MIFYSLQTEQQQNSYKTYLSLICSLSRLFSDSNEPYLHYRVAENIFCKAFEADNFSRSDCSADARKNQIGVGLKTFLHNNSRTLQKVAEFNSDRKHYAHFLGEPEKFIHHISQLRNERLEFTKRAHGIEYMMYHCVTRENNKLNFYEMPMYAVDIDSIKLQKVSSSSISFTDRYNEYSFHISKSTLLKRFITNQAIDSIPINILENPLELLLQTSSLTSASKEDVYQESIILPLYSIKNNEKIVPEKSGLNQWNAQGRPRHHNEVYIPIPIGIHRVFERFFPPRD